VKPAAFEYHRADSVDDAIHVLDQAGERGRPIAGGQSLGPMLNLRLARPEVLVDIRNCVSLRGFVDEGDSIVYGAAVTHAEFEDGQVPDATGGWLQHAARRIAYRAIRNRGTIGGSLAHADPAADWGTVLMALDAEIILQSASGARALHIVDFFTGPFSTALGAGELVIGIRVPKFSADTEFGYHKISIKSGEFATAFAVVMRDVQCAKQRAVVGAIERVPILLDDVAHLFAEPGAVEASLTQRLSDLPGTAKRLHSVALQRAILSMGKINT
jgi:carbon-monoxide dehydrogenase medium subunit